MRSYRTDIVMIGEFESTRLNEDPVHMLLFFPSDLFSLSAPYFLLTVMSLLISASLFSNLFRE